LFSRAPNNRLESFSHWSKLNQSNLIGIHNTQGSRMNIS
jgi:hypothetical protein